MTQEPITILSVPSVRAALEQAWKDSKPGITGGHEEGGFIVRDQKGNLNVVRWPKGSQNSIALPHPTLIARSAITILWRRFIPIRTRAMITCKSQARQTSVLCEMTPT
jgi:hypothetical protein